MQASTYFPKVRRMLLFLAPLCLIHFWPASTLLRRHLALATLFSWDRSSNFGALGLRWWGSPGQIYPSEGFWSRVLMWRAIAFVNFTRWIGFCMSELFRRRLHVLKDTTQMSCVRWSTSSRSSFQLMTGVTVENRFPYIFAPIILLQHGYCTFVIILFRPFTRLFINWRCPCEHFSPNLQPLLVL